jgi:hypothetical protein
LKVAIERWRLPIVPSRSTDPRRALTEAAAAAFEGDPRAQAVAGRLLLDEPDGDPAQAREWLKAAQAAGEPVTSHFINIAERRIATAGMSDDELLYDCIAVAGADHMAPAIRAAARPSLRLVASRVDSDDDIVYGASKLGGGPDLEIGTEWPSAGGRRLAFVGQLALDGQPLLGFFHDATGSRVIASATDDLARATPPEGVPSFHPCTLAPRNELTIPPPRSLEARAFVESIDDRHKYEQVVRAFALRPPYSGGRVHRSGGSPDSFAGDVPAGRGLLLQVDSEPQAGMRWGGDGRLLFWR